MKLKMKSIRMREMTEDDNGGRRKYLSNQTTKKFYISKAFKFNRNIMLIIRMFSFFFNFIFAGCC